MQGYGAVNAFSPNVNVHYDQTKSPLEIFLKDMKAQGESKFWLETCNMHALASAIDAVGGEWKYPLPIGPDGLPLYSHAIQMFLMLYSQWGQTRAPVVQDGVAENEIAANIAWIATMAARVKATFTTASTGVELISKMDASLKRGSANLVSYLTDYKTGHYINQIWRTPENGTFTCMDSWPGNVHCTKGGDHELYPDSFFIQRCNPDRLRFIEIAKA